MTYREHFEEIKESLKAALKYEDELEINEVEEYNDLVAAITYHDAKWEDEYPKDSGCKR